MLMRAQLAQPGSQFVDANTFNGLFSVHASLLIFLFIIPVFAGLGNFVIPLMIGAPDMAFPRLNALSFWLLPVAGMMMLGELPRPGRRLRRRLDGLHAAVGSTAPMGQDFFSVGGPVRGRLLDHDGAQLPGDDHHDAGARDELLPPAAAGVGELRDLAAGRDRDPVHRRLAVLHPARPRRSGSTSSTPPRAGTC